MRLRNWIFSFVLCGTLLLFSVAASAESNSYLCKVVFVGTNPYGTFVNLTDLNDSPDFENTVFRIPDERLAQMFDLAKTALLYNKIVSVRVDPDVELGEVINMRLLAIDIPTSEQDPIPILPFLK